MTIIKKTDDTLLPYVAYLPERLNDHPALLIQLHGAGERGDGNTELENVLRWGFSNVVNDGNFSDCVLVMPQCPKDSFWVAKIESLRAFIDQLVREYDVDTDRIYLCGLSMGGFGTWYTAMAYPDLFAAIAPCCGGGMAWNASSLKMPIWTFHGLDDSVVSPSQTIEMVTALKPLNPHLKYDLYEGVGHDSWIRAISEETLAWLLSQKKAE